VGSPPETLERKAGDAEQFLNSIWKEILRDYFPILPPFEFKSFDDMSKKEAKNYFDWFMETKSAKLEQLKKLVDDTGYESCRLDYSDESLIYLWRWYLKNVELLDRPEEEIREEVERETAGLTRIAISKGGVMTELNKEQMYEHFYNEKPHKKISTPWRFIARDIGLYLGECLIRKHEDRGLYWGFTKKKTFNHFKPAVMGLKSRGVDLEERMETGDCGEIERATEYSIDSKARRLAYGENWDENALLDSFRKIEEFVYLKHSPSNLIEVREMNEKEAREYFGWYVYMIPFHIKDLSMCTITDFSIESLVPVWCRYLERLEFAEVTEQKKIERMKMKKRTKKPLAILEINPVFPETPNDEEKNEAQYSFDCNLVDIFSVF